MPVQLVFEHLNDDMAVTRFRPMPDDATSDSRRRSSDGAEDLGELG